MPISLKSQEFNAYHVFEMSYKYDMSKMTPPNGVGGVILDIEIGLIPFFTTTFKLNDMI